MAHVTRTQHEENLNRQFADALSRFAREFSTQKAAARTLGIASSTFTARSSGVIQQGRAPRPHLRLLRAMLARGNDELKRIALNLLELRKAEPEQQGGLNYTSAALHLAPQGLRALLDTVTAGTSTADELDVLLAADLLTCFVNVHHCLFFEPFVAAGREPVHPFGLSFPEAFKSHSLSMLDREGIRETSSRAAAQAVLSGLSQPAPELDANVVRIELAAAAPVQELVVFKSRPPSQAWQPWQVHLITLQALEWEVTTLLAAEEIVRSSAADPGLAVRPIVRLCRELSTLARANLLSTAHAFMKAQHELDRFEVHDAMPPDIVAFSDVYYCGGSQSGPWSTVTLSFATIEREVEIRFNDNGDWRHADVDLPNPQRMLYADDLFPDLYAASGLPPPRRVDPGSAND